jgi:hypothetical protein
MPDRNFARLNKYAKKQKIDAQGALLIHVLKVFSSKERDGIARSTSSRRSFPGDPSYKVSAAPTLRRASCVNTCRTSSSTNALGIRPRSSLSDARLVQVRGVHHGELYVAVINVDAAVILDQERNSHDLLRTGTDT